MVVSELITDSVVLYSGCCHFVDTMSQQGSRETREFCNGLWNNWTQKGGSGKCEGCPAHWSNREDFPGNPETRESSSGHHPFFGYGSLSDVEVVILGHEPGTQSIGKEDENATNYAQKTFDDARKSDVTRVPVGAGSLELTVPLFNTLSSEFTVYWSQMKKCNELKSGPEGANKTAENQCVGIGDDYEGYIREELTTVDPEYVIGLGTDVDRLLRGVYDIESLGGTFSREIATGNSESGLRWLTVQGESFKYIPTSHPSRGVPSMTKDQISLDVPDETTASEHYYQVLADDFVRQVNKGTI